MLHDHLAKLSPSSDGYLLRQVAELSPRQENALVAGLRLGLNATRAATDLAPSARDARRRPWRLLLRAYLDRVETLRPSDASGRVRG